VHAFRFLLCFSQKLAGRQGCNQHCWFWRSRRNQITTTQYLVYVSTRWYFVTSLLYYYYYKCIMHYVYVWWTLIRNHALEVLLLQSQVFCTCTWRPFLHLYLSNVIYLLKLDFDFWAIQKFILKWIMWEV